MAAYQEMEGIMDNHTYETFYRFAVFEMVHCYTTDVYKAVLVFSSNVLEECEWFVSTRFESPPFGRFKIDKIYMHEDDEL